MTFTVLQTKTDLAGVIHGTTLNKIRSVDNIFNRAAYRLLIDLDPKETIRISQLSSPIYNKVFDYPLPTDLKGNRIIDIRPQVNRTPNDKYSQQYVEDFMMYKEKLGGNFNVKWNSGSQTLRLSEINGKSANLLSQMNSITSNGTWSAGGDATNLRTDDVQYVTGGASLAFNVSGIGTTAYLENSTLDSVDISTLEDEGALFLNVYMPVVTTNVILRWGSSATDYWESTSTTQQDGNAFQVGWNLIKFNWQTATEVGTPDSSAITYARPLITYDGNPTTGFRMNGLTAQLGSIFEIEYYSKFLFKDASTGAWQETVSDDSNIINLDTDSYMIYFNMLAELTNQQINGQPANFDIGYFKTSYAEDIAKYKQKYKSETIKPRGIYYRFPRKGVRRVKYKS